MFSRRCGEVTHYEVLASIAKDVTNKKFGKSEAEGFLSEAIKQGIIFESESGYYASN